MTEKFKLIHSLSSRDGAIWIYELSVEFRPSHISCMQYLKLSSPSIKPIYCSVSKTSRKLDYFSSSDQLLALATLSKISKKAWGSSASFPQYSGGTLGTDLVSLI